MALTFAADSLFRRKEATCALCVTVEGVMSAILRGVLAR